MRYPKEHKEHTRQRIVETASRNFRVRGIDGEGVASIMQGAGLTNGAFFNHFASKEELAQAAMTHAMGERAAYLGVQLEGKRGVEGYIRAYLSARHRDAPEAGCPVASLAPEAARHSSEVRDAFTHGFVGLVDALSHAWPSLPRKATRARAIALYGLMAGCLQVARATDDEKLSGEVLSAGIRAALELVSR
ncbi:MAG: TetR/AcrR family transcriptional regulator [Luteibacter sp.]|jgi:TetR/AcrR family transcriptional repressor of nem operon